MDDRLERVESTVGDLERALAAIEQRLAALERERGVLAAPAPPPQPDDEVWAPPHVARDEFIAILSFAGRSFVALGGAYLLRALTDSAILPQAAGIALGLAYALSWLVMADRVGAAGERVRRESASRELAVSGFPSPGPGTGSRTHAVSAAFHGVVFSIIAFPLLWEATVRFKYLSPDATAAALTLVTALAFGVAVRQRLQALAWIVTLTALSAALGLIGATAIVAPFAAFLVVLGVATLWLGYANKWVVLRWPVAFVADVAVLALTLRMSNSAWAEPTLRVVAVQLLLLNGYLASIVVRTLVRARDVNGFEIVQSVAALGVGFGGTVYVARLTGSGVGVLALVNLAFGAGCYAVAFRFIARREGLQRNFYFYTSLALILILVSSALLLSRASLAPACAALAVISTWAAERVNRVALVWHGAVYLIVAGAASGLLAAAGRALVGPVTTAWDPFMPPAIITLAAAAVCWMLPRPAGARTPVFSESLPRLLVATVLFWSVGGWLVGLATPPLSGTPGAGADAGIVATIRTTVLAVAALALAWIGRHDRFRESAWLLYPVLMWGGLKLVLEDLPQSKPATLFVALALYGGALIFAPRISHHRTV
ncbi:MAG: hypothetical protein Q7J25_00095 [Vicinamibacterales bacterium]|nr:hypothetical protein [Vicinamibacterales bacterium]